MKMLENNNRKFIKTLSTNCLKANKSRNRIAILAIILTTVLFMALATVYEGMQVSLKEQSLRQAGTKFMFSIKNLTKEEAERLVSDKSLTEAGIERYVANAINPELNNMNAIAGWVSQTNAENSFMELEKGRYPQNENELACDSEVLRLLGLPYKTGSTFTLQYAAGEKTMEKQMTVCGIWKGKKYEQNASIFVSEAFVEEALQNYDGEYAAFKETSYDVRGSFADEKHIGQKLDKLVEKLGYDPKAKRGEEGFLIHHINPAYEAAGAKNPAESALIGGIAILLILAAGYLIIFNIFKISVEKDIRLYGQLKTIGTSPKQIRSLVIRQGMRLAITGIPAGLILGCLLGNAFLPFVMSNTWADETAFIIPSVWVWLLSALFTLLTVRISCGKPSRTAGKISPIEALKYHGAKQILKTKKKGRQSAHRLLSMAYGNLARNKGKTILVVLSISMSAVLLNSILNYTGSMDKETYIRREAVTDFNVSNAELLKPMSKDYQKIVQSGTAQELSGLANVTDFGKIYCYMLPEEQNPDHFADTAKITRINQQDMPESIEAFDPDETPGRIEAFDPNRMLYGFDENALAQTKLIEGGIDYEKLCTGDYIIMQGFLSDTGEYDYNSQEFHAGDTIEAVINGNVREYTVMAVVGAASSLNMSYSKGGYESMVFAEPVFLGLFPAMQNPIHCIFNAKPGKFEELNEEIGGFAEGHGLSVITKLTAEEDFKEMQNTYNMAGVIAAAILGMIGILNLINVIMTGAIARQQEFASMRSIGMSRRQLRRMMIYEGILYAALSALAGLALSGLLSVTLVRNLTSGLWFMAYHFTLFPAIAASMLCLMLAAGISAATDKIWNKGSIVELLRKYE